MLADTAGELALFERSNNAETMLLAGRLVTRGEIQWLMKPVPAARDDFDQTPHDQPERATKAPRPSNAGLSS